MPVQGYIPEDCQLTVESRCSNASGAKIPTIGDDDEFDSEFGKKKRNCDDNNEFDKGIVAKVCTGTRQAGMHQAALAPQ